MNKNLETYYLYILIINYKQITIKLVLNIYYVNTVKYNNANSMHNINTIKMFPYFKYILLIVYLVKKNNILIFITLYITYYKFSILSLPLILSHKKHIIEICYNFILSGKIGH